MTDGRRRILVFIATMLDRELEATINDLVENCSDPERLDIVVINQDDETRTTAGFPSTVSLLNIHYSKTRGLAWARSLLNSFLDLSHEFVLNIDSHSRFEAGWDRTLEKAIESYPGKVVISAYPGEYFLQRPETTNGIFLNYVVAVNSDYSMSFGQTAAEADADGYVRYSTIAGGFNFSRRTFWAEVAIDPFATWNWHESDLTLRAFTHGYDIVNIPSPPVYHLYSHDNRKFSPPFTWECPVDSQERYLSKLQRRHSTFTETRYELGSERTLEEFESVYGVCIAEKSLCNMISIPVAVHSDLFEWQLNLFWFNHRRTYGHTAARKAMAAVVARNTSTDRSFAEMQWDLSIPHRIVGPYFEFLPDVQEAGLALPLNLQTAVFQLIETMDDSQIVEILDCDMCHIRPAPRLSPSRGEVIVSAIYESWHLHSLGEQRQHVQRRTRGAAERYNGGFVPIISRVDTLRQLLPKWIEAHHDMLKDSQLSDLQKWWAGMYALQVACENSDIRMIDQDILYVPGINALSPHHYVVHYSCDPRFDKKRFPDVSCSDFEDNVFYSRVKEWMSMMG